MVDPLFSLRCFYVSLLSGLTCDVLTDVQIRSVHRKPNVDERTKETTLMSLKRSRL